MCRPIMFLLILCPGTRIWAIDELILLESKNIPLIASSLYAARLGLSPTDPLINHPHFLKACFSLDRHRKLTANDVAEVRERLQRQPQAALHLPSLTKQLNQDYLAWNRQKPWSEFDINSSIDLAFLSIADRFDGSLDGHLKIHDVAGLYRLALLEEIPLAALCFECRHLDQWSDIRTLIGTSEELLRSLPKSILKLRKSSQSASNKMKQLTLWLGQNIEYESESYGDDYWQTPFETFFTESGDCEDMAFLLQSLAEHLAIKAKIVLGVLLSKGEDGQLQRLGHAWVEYEGIIYDPARRDSRNANYVAYSKFDSQQAHFIFDQEERTDEHMIAGIKRH